MKTIKFFSLASTIFFLSFFVTPSLSFAVITNTDVSVSSSQSNYVEYVNINGVTYKYTYTDDGKIVYIEVED